MLNLPQLTSALHNAAIGHTIRHYESVGTTMEVARGLADDAGVASGAVVVADEQTTGRGRMGRTWEAPLGLALLATIILKGDHLPANTSRLAMLAGVAAARAIEEMDPVLAGTVQLKWPNDVLLNGGAPPGGKVAGMLIDAVYAGSRPAYALLGIGINVNQTATELPAPPPGAPQASSLALALGHPVERTALLIALCRQLSAWVAAEPDELYATWRSMLQTLGQSVTVRSVEGEYTGMAVEVTEDGALVVEGEGGERRTFSAGDVTLRAG